MNRIITFLALVVFTAAGLSAQVQTYAKPLADFTVLTVADNINVTIKHNPDSMGLAVFTCPKDMAHILTFSQKKSKLKLESISDQMPDAECPDVTLYVNTIREINNWGDSTVLVLSNNWAEEFKAKIIGNGNIEVHDIDTRKMEASVKAGKGRVFLEGRAKTSKFSIAGAGTIEAEAFTSDKISCTIYGTGNIDCHPLKQLSLFGAGSGSVYYIGEPSIKNTGLGVHIRKVEN